MSDFRGTGGTGSGSPDVNLTGNLTVALVLTVVGNAILQAITGTSLVLTGALTAASATIAGAIGSATATFQGVTATLTGLLSAGSAAFAGAITSVTNITASGTLQANVVSGNAITNIDGRMSPYSGMGFKNRFSNPRFLVNQRVYSTSTAANRIADRWTWSPTLTAGSCTAALLPSTTSDYKGNKVRFTCTTINTSPGAADVTFFRTAIEGNVISDWYLGTAGAKTVTLRFRANASVACKVVLIFRNAANNRYFAFPITIAAGSTIYSFQLPLDTTGTWAIDNTIGFDCFIVLQAGSSFTGAAIGAWTAGTSKFVSATTDCDLMGTAAKWVEFEDFGIETGNSETLYEVRPYWVELIHCMRYFEKSYDQGTAIGTATNTGAVFTFLPVTAAVSNLSMQGLYKVNKRVSTPTINVYSTGTGTVSQIRDATSSADKAATVIIVGETSFLASAVWPAVSINAQMQWTSEAELI